MRVGSLWLRKRDSALIIVERKIGQGLWEICEITQAIDPTAFKFYWNNYQAKEEYFKQCIKIREKV